MAMLKYLTRTSNKSTVPVHDIQSDSAIAVLSSIEQPASPTALASSEQASKRSDLTESSCNAPAKQASRKSTRKFLA